MDMGHTQVAHRNLVDLIVFMPITKITIDSTKTMFFSIYVFSMTPYIFALIPCLKSVLYYCKELSTHP
jgi:hypothetical protein